MRRASGPTVTLFPFLTVLLCASGTLIVLLIALSQHVRDTPAAAPPVAAAPVPPSPPPPVPVAVEPPAPPPEAPTVPRGPRRIVRLPYRGPDAITPLRRRLAAARASARDMSVNIAAAESRRAGADGQLAETRLATREAVVAVRSARTRLATLEQMRTADAAAAERAAAEVEEFRNAVAAAAEDDSPRSLLPVVRTPDGVTADRPILIECVAEGARLRPYGVTVPAGAAGPAPDGGSPVAAGVAAASAATGEGYVLLIVRPDGLPAFYRAGGALSAAGVRFGYELMDADAEIAWGEAGAADAASVAAAVREALRTYPQTAPEEFSREFAGATGEGAPGPFSRGGGGVAGGAFGPAGEGGTTWGGAGSAGAGESFAARGGSGDGGWNMAGGTGDPVRPATARRAFAKNFPGGSPADQFAVGPAVPASPAGAAGAGRDAPTAASPEAASAGPPPPGGAAAGTPAAPEGTAPRSSGGGSAAGSVAPRNSGSAGSARGESDGSGESNPSRGSSPNGGASRSGGSARGGEASRAGGPGGGGRPGGGGGSRGGAAGPDDRIRFTVRTPATLASSHLWIGGRWVPLPADDARLSDLLRAEFDRGLADRGDPPAGFRWSPELRLAVRPDGRGQVSRLAAAAERAGATVKLDRGSR